MFFVGELVRAGRYGCDYPPILCVLMCGVVFCVICVLCGVVLCVDFQR